MPRRHGLGADFARDRDEPREVQLGVAGDSRNRSATREIILDERTYYAALEFVFEIQHVERYA
jgi:hypothetical protein